MKQQVTLNFCDNCGYKEDDPTSTIAKEKCSVCDKWYCDDCYKVDSYYTTQHCKSEFKSLPICKYCWDIAKSAEFPRIGSYSSSGSTFAISVGSFTRYFVEQANAFAAKELSRVLKDIVDKKKVEYDKKQAIKKLEQEYQEKLEALKV